jgi:hypothetical protein
MKAKVCFEMMKYLHNKKYVSVSNHYTTELF